MKNLLTNLNKPCLECGGKVHYEDGGSFTPHIMYNPETGEPIEVASPEEHATLAEQGFLSEEEAQQMQQQQMEVGGQSQENGAALMQKNINSHFKKLSKNRNNMFKDDTAPMNQDTDSYGALKLNNFKGYIQQNVKDVMLQEATEAFYKQKANIDMFGVDGAKAIQQEENPQEQAMYGGASNQYYAPGGAYNNGQGNFGMGDSNFDITPWANDYRQTLQENQFNTGALGSMFGSAAENIAGNFYNPQYKTKTKTKLLFGDDEFDPGEAKTDRHGNVKREKSWENSKGETVEGDIKMTKGKIDRDWFGEAYTDDKGVFHDSRSDDKKKFRQWKKGQRNEARRTPNASNQAIFDTRIREQVGEDGNLSNIDMPTLQTDMNELLTTNLTNPFDMANYNWKDQYDLTNGYEYGGMPEQYAGIVSPDGMQMYDTGGQLHTQQYGMGHLFHQAPAMGIPDPSYLPQNILQNTQSPADYLQNKNSNPAITGGYNPNYNWNREPTPVDSEYMPSWMQPQISDPTGGIGATLNSSRNPGYAPGVGGRPYYNMYDPNRNYAAEMQNFGNQTEEAEVIEEKKKPTSTGSKKKGKAAAETVEEIQDGTDGGGSDESSLEEEYKKGEKREWDGEKWVTISDDGAGRGNYVENEVDQNNGNRGGNGLYVPPQYGYGQDPRWGNNLYRGNMTNMRPGRGAMPIAYDPSQTRLTEYDYKTKTGLMGRAMGLGPRKEHTRMRFSHAGDAPWRENADSSLSPAGPDAPEGTMTYTDPMTGEQSSVSPEEAERIRQQKSGQNWQDFQVDPRWSIPDAKDAVDANGPYSKEGQRKIKKSKRNDKKVARQEKNKDWTGQSQFDKDGNPLTKDAERALEQELKNNPPPGLSPYTTGASYGYGGVPFPEQYPQAAYYPHQYEDGGPHGGPRMSYNSVEPTTDQKFNTYTSWANRSAPFNPEFQDRRSDEYRNNNWRPTPPPFIPPTPTSSGYVKGLGRAEYAMGGEYELTQDEVAQLLAAGGQIEYL